MASVFYDFLFGYSVKRDSASHFKVVDIYTPARDRFNRACLIPYKGNEIYKIKQILLHNILPAMMKNIYDRQQQFGWTQKEKKILK